MGILIGLLTDNSFLNYQMRKIGKVIAIRSKCDKESILYFIWTLLSFLLLLPFLFLYNLPPVQIIYWNRTVVLSVNLIFLHLWSRIEQGCHEWLCCSYESLYSMTASDWLPSQRRDVLNIWAIRAKPPSSGLPVVISQREMGRPMDWRGMAPVNRSVRVVFAPLLTMKEAQFRPASIYISSDISPYVQRFCCCHVKLQFLKTFNENLRIHQDLEEIYPRPLWLLWRLSLLCMLFWIPQEL